MAFLRARRTVGFYGLDFMLYWLPPSADVIVVSDDTLSFTAQIPLGTHGDRLMSLTVTSPMQMSPSELRLLLNTVERKPTLHRKIKV